MNEIDFNLLFQFISSLFNIFNIYLSVECLLLDEKVYPITFLCIFAVSKILLLIATLWKKDLSLLPFFFFDLFQLSWIYRFKERPQDFEGTLTNFSYLSGLVIFPLILSQQVIFFGTDFLTSSNLSDSYLSIMAYVSFIASLFMLCLFIILQKYDENESRSNLFKDHYLTIFSSGFVQANLFIFSDPIGIKLGYYAIAIELTSIIFFILTHPFSEEVCEDVISYLMGVMNQSRVYQTSFNSSKNVISHIRFYKFEEYSNQYGRHILSIIYTIIFFCTLDLNSLSSITESVFLINIIIGSVIGLMYMIIFITDLKYYLYQVKTITLNTEYIDHKSLQKIPLKKGYLKQITIVFQNDKQGMNEIHYNNIGTHYDCQQCELTVEIIQKLSSLKAEGVEISCIYRPKLCCHHFIEVFSHVQYPLDRNMYQNDWMYDLDKTQINKIAIQRYSNGFFCSNDDNPTNIFFEKMLEFYFDKGIYFRNLQSTTLSIHLFYFRISDYMPISYCKVLYDLHDL